MNVDSFFFFFKEKPPSSLIYTSKTSRKTCFCIPMDLGSAEGSVILYN